MQWRDLAKIVAAVAAFCLISVCVRNCENERWREPKHYAEVGAGIDLNTASPKELRTLPDIGPVFADRIVQNRPYVSADDVIRKVPQFTAGRWKEIRDYVAPFPEPLPARVIVTDSQKAPEPVPMETPGSSATPEIVGTPEFTPTPVPAPDFTRDEANAAWQSHLNRVAAPN